MQSTFNHLNYDFTFSDSDVVEPSAWIPAGEYNPHNVRPFLLHDHGFTLAVVFASCLEDAIDAAVDADKLDRFMVSEEDRKDYEDDEGITFLGSAGEPFDIEGLDVVELPNPALSFCAQFNARIEQKVA
jgi:hypothetical protein